MGGNRKENIKNFDEAPETKTEKEVEILCNKRSP
jgi:hypothetical protein